MDTPQEADVVTTLTSFLNSFDDKTGAVEEFSLLKKVINRIIPMCHKLAGVDIRIKIAADDNDPMLVFVADNPKTNATLWGLGIPLSIFRFGAHQLIPHDRGRFKPECGVTTFDLPDIHHVFDYLDSLTNLGCVEQQPIYANDVPDDTTWRSLVIRRSVVIHLYLYHSAIAEHYRQTNNVVVH